MSSDNTLIELVKQIDNVIESDGDITPLVKDRLMFSVVKTIVVSIVEMREDLKSIESGLREELEMIRCTTREIEKRVTVLEKRNVVSWCLRHPSPVITVIVLLTLLLLNHYATPLLLMFGIKIP